MDSLTRTFQVLSISSSLVLSGTNMGASILTLPILYTRPPSISTPIFQEFYSRGAVTLVPLGVFSALCSAVVVYLLPAQRGLWGFAGLATITQLPWTLLVMMRGIKRLSEIAQSKEVQEKVGKEEVAGLLKEWAWMNMVRGGFAVVGGLVGLWAVIDGPK